MIQGEPGKPGPRGETVSMKQSDDFNIFTAKLIYVSFTLNVYIQV